MTHKYVRDKFLGFVIWPRTDQVFHSHVGRLFGSPISAGFVYFIDGKPTCYGESESLRLDSLSEDSEKLAEQLNKC